jgi:hypothetical protein
MGPTLLAAVGVVVAAVVVLPCVAEESLAVLWAPFAAEPTS